MAQETITKPCAFVRASSEMPGEGPAKEVADEARGWMRELFTALAREAGARNAPALAQQLQVLFDGALTGSAMDGNTVAATTARTMAAALLDAATR